MARGGPLLLGGNLIPYINQVNRKLCAYTSECQKDTIIVAFVVAIHVQCLVLVYLSLVKIKYSVCVWKKKKDQSIGHVLFICGSE